MTLLSKQQLVGYDYLSGNWSTLALRLAGIGTLSLTLFYLGKIWYSYKTFKRMGIKTPKYRFIYGNLCEILEKTQSECLREWTGQLGKTYGYYEGHLPILVTSDTDIIHEVFIKQFSNFMARKQYPFQFADDDPRMDLFLSTNKRWKRMRNIINPTFSPSKLKELAPIMQRSTERFIQILEKHDNEEIAISEFLDRYTMDTIWNSAVGMDIDVQSNPENIYMKKALHVFKDLVELKFSFRLTSYFHELRPYILGLVSLNSWLLSKFQAGKMDDMADPLFWLTQNIHNIIQDRQNNTITRKDFTQLLMEAKIDDHELLRRKEKVELSKFRLDKEMSFDEIKFNLVGFLLAGFETTSTSLNYCFYILANHPHEQQKLQQELDSYFGSDVMPTFENINEVEYLDWFIKEALRMYPISSNTVNRRCMFPTTLKGIQIEPGVSVTVDVLSLHYDPEIWGPTDPNEFNPSRFSPEFKRNANAYLPFGLGPRNCVGMRYAVIEMKLALSKVLLKFNVHSTPNTPTTLQYIEGTVRRPKNKIYIRLEKRAAATLDDDDDS